LVHIVRVMSGNSCIEIKDNKDNIMERLEATWLINHEGDYLYV